MYEGSSQGVYVSTHICTIISPLLGSMYGVGQSIATLASGAVLFLFWHEIWGYMGENGNRKRLSPFPSYVHVLPWPIRSIMYRG
jgi:hypothetical protein